MADTIVRVVDGETVVVVAGAEFLAPYVGSAATSAAAAEAARVAVQPIITDLALPNSKLAAIGTDLLSGSSAIALVAANMAAIQAVPDQVTAAQVARAGAEAAQGFVINALGQVTRLDYRTTVGRPVGSVLAGTSGGISSTFVLNSAIPAARALRRVRVRVANVGQVVIKAFTLSGNTFTQVDSRTLDVVAGDNLFDLTTNFGTAGQYLGAYSSVVIRAPTATQDNGEFYTASGNATSVSKVAPAPNTTLQPQIGFDLYELVSDVASITSVDAKLSPYTGAIGAKVGAITDDVNQFDIHDLDNRKMLAFGAAGGLVDSGQFVQSVAVAAGLDNTKAAIARLPRITAVPRVASGSYGGISTAGQSNDAGGGTSVITITPYFNNKRSVNTTGAGAFIPLIEGEGSRPETSLTAAAAQASDLLLRRIPQWATYSIDFVGNKMGVGGAVYSQIKKGTTTYADGLARVSAAKVRATAEGRPYTELVLLWKHGETDGSDGVARATYKGYVKEFHTDWNTDVAPITGQTSLIPMLITQLVQGGTTSATSLAMLDAAEEQAGIYVIAPGYIATFESDGLHYTADDQRMFGMIEGKMIDRYLQDGKSPSTVRPTAQPITILDKRTFDIEFFVPVPPLVWDIDWVAPGDAGLGFAIYNSAGGAELAMATAPQIIGGNRVRIRMVDDLPAGWRYTYATKVYTGKTAGVGRGRWRGARGNLCDSDRTPSYFSDLYGTPYIPANFCAIFDKVGA